MLLVPPDVLDRFHIGCIKWSSEGVIPGCLKRRSLTCKTLIVAWSRNCAEDYQELSAWAPIIDSPLF